jgi:NADPH:quinone reductase-like Zn-dependent oxidoreductase
MKATRRLPIAAPFAAALCMAALLITGAAPAQTPAPGANGNAAQMRAIVYRSYGSPDVLRLEEIDKPVPNDDQLLVKVHAASVNPLDWHYMEGTPYVGRLFEFGVLAPKVTRLGVDYAGTVEAVGRNITRFKPGDEVFGGKTGAFAEYVCVREDRAVALKPANMTFEQAAAVPIAGLTALQALRDRGKVQPGQKVLINGASGGVGTFAVQIARSYGADVTGVCSTRNLEMVRSLGANQVIDYTREDFTTGGQRYDLILDNVGNHPLLDCRRALSPRGKYVLIGGGGVNDGRWVGPLTRPIKALMLSPFVSQEMGMMLAELNPQDLATLGDLMKEGKVTPVIDRRYKLSEVPAALRYLEEGHARGKVVITMDPETDTAPLSPGGVAGSAGLLQPGPVILAVVAVVLVVPVVLALVLNRRYQRRNPGKRPYRWGYYFGLMSVVAGLVLGLMFESGASVVIACGVFYAVLAWFFAQRHRWAWVALTIVSCNPVVWVINFIYLRKRWVESAV